MDAFQNNSLDTRIEQLETTVGGIQRALRQFDAALAAQGIALPPLETAEPVEQAAPPTNRLPDPAPATSLLPQHTPPPDAFAGWDTGPIAGVGMTRHPASAAPVQPISAPDMEEFEEGEPLPEEILRCAQNDSEYAQNDSEWAQNDSEWAQNGSVPTRAEPRGGFDIVRLTEYWMNKVAIGLLLFGVVFLFQYSVAQGWLTAPIRVDFGYALGLALLVVGLRLYEDRPHFSQVLLGGSVGTLYITTYAANQVFLLMPYIPALITMVAVTALAFWLSVRQNSAVLSLIGTVGGLATPFLLYTGEHNVPGLMAYICVLLAGTSAVYFYRGWHSLLWTSFGGVWGVLMVTITAVGPAPSKIPFADWTALEFGIVFAWLAFSAVPVVRDVLWVNAPERWQHPRLDFLADMLVLPADARRRNDPHIHLMTVLTPFLALLLSTQVVVLTQVNWGRALVVISLVYALAYLGLRRRHEALAYTHGLLSLALLTLGLVLILEGSTLFFALALEAAVLHFVSGRIKDKGIATLGHVVSVPVILWLGWRLAVDRVMRGPMLSVDSLTDLAVIGLLLASASRMYWRRPAVIYLAVAHIAFMCLLTREFYNVTPGLGVVLVVWAVYGTALHLLARRQTDLGEAAGRAAAGFTLAGHSAFAAVLALLGGRLLSAHSDNSVVVFNLQAGINFLVIGLAFGCAFLMRSHLEAQVYRTVAHVALLGLIVVELLALPYGQDWAMLACVLYATALHYIARRQSDGWASLLGHAIFAGLLPWLGLRLFATYNLNADWATTGLTSLLPSGELPIFNAMSMVDLAVILLAFYTTTLLGSREERLAYRMLGHVAALGWLWRELSALPHGWDYMVVAWAVYAAGLFLLAHRNTDRGTAMPPTAQGESLIAHSAFAVLVPALLLRLFTAQPDLTPFLNIRAAADLAVIALSVAVSRLMRSREEGAVYRFLAHGAILALLWRELILLPGGNGLVTVAWGVYALAILFVGLRLRSMPFIYTAIATLMLVIAKLFLVDLAALELIWRSLLFIGFGVVFLMLSYHLQSWLRRQTSPL